MNLRKLNTEKNNILIAALSGLLLTGAFPKIGLDWLAWFALVPLLYALKDQPAGAGFRLGFITGLVHFLSAFILAGSRHANLRVFTGSI